MNSFINIFILALSFVALSEALNCNVLNSLPGMFTQQCPGQVNQCMKFVCKTNGGQNIVKGCNDPGDLRTSCTALQQNCQSQGGQGQCYTCSYEYCNESPRTGIFILSIFALVTSYLLL
ncbi:hypothetical protein WR25_11407 [Diploscapter pachys]|uniref:Uncharacterized protein n=1 Tax=Diploscapter pachys TaxID=2018661 RepID=A0A2A2JRW0_9BILA|nr:hypothetical protein WR25_11407 [Diploscapter pachys]